MTERTVYAILLPLDGHPDGVYCVCRAETPEGAADVIEYLLKSGDKSLTLVTVKREARFD